jgi:hypothetical protein
MARIRTIKPEFWTDERLTECSMSARLLFIGMLNFADDNGNLVYSAKRLKMQIFPGDAVDVQPMLNELITHGVLNEYEINSNKYIQIKGFKKHQLINRPSATSIPEMILPISKATHGVLSESSLTEWKGEESKGEDIEEAKASLSPAELPDCPHELLIDLFEKHLPSLAQPKKSLWRAGRNAPALKARWRWVMTAMHEKGERKGQRLALTKDDAVAWFERYFAYVARSEFLTGTSDDWSCNLGWLVNASNFEKVLAGNYQNKLEAVA